MERRECEQIQELLVAHLDDELEVGEREAVDAHLETCEACRREQDRIVETLRLTRAWQPEDDRAHLRERLAALEDALCRARPPQIMTPREAMAYLRLDEAQFAQLLPGLPKIDLAGQIRFRLRSLEQWLAMRETASGEPWALVSSTGRGEAGPIMPSSVQERQGRMVLL